jgi:putative membrane protein
MRMFIDYITVMLINMVAGMVILAALFAVGLTRPSQAGAMVPGLLMAGAVAFLTGLHMSLTWPLPKMEGANLSWANIAFGEMSVLFGVLLLGAAVALWRGWPLTYVAVYGLFAGAAAIVVGSAIGYLGLTKAPALSAAGFILAGAAGILSLPAVLWPAVAVLRWLDAAVWLVAAGIWALTGYMSYWMHIVNFSK